MVTSAASLSTIPDRGVQYISICYTQRLEDIGAAHSPLYATGQFRH
jgi:hypothetical protein